MVHICERTGALLAGLDVPAAVPEDQCPVHWAEQVAKAACEAACGRDVMCRDGMFQLYLILRDIARGKGRARDLELIPELCALIQETAGCDLAVQAARQIAALAEQRQELWRAHVLRRLCRPGVCPMPAPEGAGQTQQPTLRRRRRGAAQ